MAEFGGSTWETGAWSLLLTLSFRFCLLSPLGRIQFYVSVVSKGCMTCVCVSFFFSFFFLSFSFFFSFSLFSLSFSLSLCLFLVFFSPPCLCSDLHFVMHLPCTHIVTSFLSFFSSPPPPPTRPPFPPQNNYRAWRPD